MLQRKGTIQGVAGAGIPPGQKNPTEHNTAEELVDPATQPYPGDALQAPLHVGKVRPVVDP